LFWASPGDDIPNVDVSVRFSRGIIFITFIVFFRDPEREPPDDPSLLVSPADGRVVMIKDVDDAQIGEATRISIFLSLFDVHVNRSPLKAQVVSTEHHDGKFNHAASTDASEVNERNAILLQAGSGKIVVRQIAGLGCEAHCLLDETKRYAGARRKTGHQIRFARGCDPPRETQLLVKVEDIVRGGKLRLQNYGKF
jgi:phosphatidylserine decarboxylase